MALFNAKHQNTTKHLPATCLQNMFVTESRIARKELMNASAIRLPGQVSLPDYIT